MTWKFHVLPEKENLPYDAIIGRYFMKELQIDVIYSEYVLVWESVRLIMQKIQNGKWTDLNLTDQENPGDIKEQIKRLGRILDTNDEKADLELEFIKLTHFTKYQQVILLGCIKRYKYLFDGNLGEWTVPPVEIPLKYEDKPYHAREFTIPVIHIKDFKKDLDILVSIGVLKKVNFSEWAAPSFTIPKNYVRVRFISGFR